MVPHLLIAHYRETQALARITGRSGWEGAPNGDLRVSVLGNWCGAT